MGLLGLPIKYCSGRVGSYFNPGSVIKAKLNYRLTRQERILLDSVDEIKERMKRKIGEIYKRGNETVIKTDHGTKTYYRYLVEEYLGFELPPGYSVHHLDFDHTNNTLENFCIIPTPLHTWLHRTRGTRDLFISNLKKIRKNPSVLINLPPPLSKKTKAKRCVAK